MKRDARKDGTNTITATQRMMPSRARHPFVLRISAAPKVSRINLNQADDEDRDPPWEG